MENVTNILNNANKYPKNFRLNDLVCHPSHPRILKFVRQESREAFVLDKDGEEINPLVFPVAELVPYEAFNLEAHIAVSRHLGQKLILAVEPPNRIENYEL